ncbi:MAG: N-acetyltransferase family protein [Cytophagales bacterium]|nr:N-acetyltransferase family protein [Cytophagales bacterium]
MIRNVALADAGQICDIYNYYILHTIITFEESEVRETEMRSRIEKTIAKFPWIVYEADSKVIGFAYASEWKSRCAYKHSLETTVYLRKGEEGNGVGSKLYAELIDRLKKMEYHALIGGISLPNEASIRLHEKFGFEKIGQFKEVGYKFGKWIDVGYWELIF